MFFTPQTGLYIPPQSQVIDRITFYDRPELTLDENKLFRGGYFAVIRLPLHWTQWEWDQQERRNKRKLIQFTYTPKIPFKGNQSDELILRAASGLIYNFGCFTDIKILETQEGTVFGG